MSELTEEQEREAHAAKHIGMQAAIAQHMKATGGIKAGDYFEYDGHTYDVLAVENSQARIEMRPDDTDTTNPDATMHISSETRNGETRGEFLDPAEALLRNIFAGDPSAKFGHVIAGHSRTVETADGRSITEYGGDLAPVHPEARIIDLDGPVDETDDAVITLRLLISMTGQTHNRWRVTPSDGGSWDYVKA